MRANRVRLIIREYGTFLRFIMKIVIKQIKESPFLIEIAEAMTVFDVKATISLVNGVLPKFQQLIFRGNILSNTTQVDSLHLHEMGSLYLVAKPPQRPRSAGLPRFMSSRAPNGFCSMVDSLRETNPSLSCVLNDRETILENMEAYRNPQTRAELLKSMDRTMNLVEMRAGGFQEIVEHHKYVEKIFDVLMEQHRPDKNIPTIIPKPPKSPSIDPLPNPFFQDFLYDSLLFIPQIDPNTNEIQVEQTTKNMLAILGLLFAKQKNIFGQGDEEMEEKPEKIENSPYVQIFHDKGKQKVFPVPSTISTFDEDINDNLEPESSSDADSFSDVDID